MKFRRLFSHFDMYMSKDINRRKTTVLKSARTSTDAGIWLIILMFQFSFYVYVDWCNETFPKPQSSNSVTIQFSEEKAREYLLGLTSLGSRIVGSTTNQKYAVEYIWSELEKIKKDSKMKSHAVKIDYQTAKGSFDLDFLGGFTNVYENINNIIFNLVPNDVNSSMSLLINCHYDTFLETEGASDDAVSCATMLALIHSLTMRSRFVRNVGLIFLFNGAEETILQGSHAFVVSHPWFKKVKAFINLEAAGVGGKDLFFQSGSPWLTKLYRHVPYPYASSFAQQIFQSGVVQSDTDFRIFRDFGNVPGVDIAYIRNGYFYHTRHDTPDKIPVGCIQRTGENVMALIRGISNQAWDSSWTSDDPVFFDVMGVALVMYSLETMISANVVACLAFHLKIMWALFVARDVRARRQHAWRLILGIVFILASWLTSISVVTCIALVLDLVGCSMTWFNNTWLLIGLYSVPSLAATYFVMTRLKLHWLVGEGLSLAEMESIISDSVMAILSTVLLILSWKQLASSFIVFIFLFSMHIRSLFMALLYLVRGRLTDLVYFNLALHLAALFHHQVFSLYYIEGIMTTFVPLMGRSGPSMPSDVIIGILVSILTNYHFMCHVSLLFLLDVPVPRKIFGYTFLLFLFLVTCTGLGFPFSDNPEYPVNQRIFIQECSPELVLKPNANLNATTLAYTLHLRRKFNPPLGDSTSQPYEDSLISFIPLDRTSLSHLRPIRELNISKFSLLPCSDQPYCGWAYYLPLMSHMNQVYHVPAERLNVMPEVFVRFDQVLRSPEFSHVNFTFTGPEYMSIYVSPCQGMSLVAWNIGSGVPFPTKMPYGVKTPQYFVFVSFGMVPLEPLWLNLTLKTSISSAGCVVQVAVVGHYMPMVDRPKISTTLSYYLEHMPSWASVLHTGSTYESWTI